MTQSSSQRSLEAAAAAALVPSAAEIMPQALPTHAWVVMTAYMSLRFIKYVLYYIYIMMCFIKSCFGRESLGTALDLLISFLRKEMFLLWF